MIERKAVLVTGAASGLGEATVEELVRRGFHVFAGVRSPADGERLRAAFGARCTPVALDVTDAASIAAAAAELRRAGGIYGLVNNAGIAVTGPLEYLPLDLLRRQFEVNVIGALAVTQAVLPQLRRSLGRVVNVGSIGSRTALPILGPYAASKAALALLSQSLRLELAPFDIGVSYVEPGAFRTPIWQRSRAAAAALRERLPPVALGYYRRMLDAVDSLAAQTERRAGDPRRVAATIADALASPRPRPRYTVGADTRAQRALALVPLPLRERLIARRLDDAARA